MGVKYRSSHAPTGRENFYTNVAPIITGLGASVVILGALFKIMHWPGAAPMLIIGLGTEAVLFGLFAFAPPITEPDWTLVHPELAELPTTAKGQEKQKGGVVKKLDEMMSDANISGDTLSKLGKSFASLNESVSKIGEITNAAVATNEYAGAVKSATGSMQELSKAYSTTVTAMSAMANASTDAKEYHSQVQSITKNLSALNAVYEMELHDANSHLKAMNKFYSHLSSAMENMSDASKDTEAFKNELSKLTTNLTSLNGIYGNMLAAMRG